MFTDILGIKGDPKKPSTKIVKINLPVSLLGNFGGHAVREGDPWPNLPAVQTKREKSKHAGLSLPRLADCGDGLALTQVRDGSDFCGVCFRHSLHLDVILSVREH